jgi:hypothetical protein
MRKIITNYYTNGPHGPYVVADDDGNNIQLTRLIDSSIGLEENHEKAALALCHELGWSGRLELINHTRYNMTWKLTK